MYCCICFSILRGSAKDGFTYIDASNIHRQIVINHQKDNCKSLERFPFLWFILTQIIRKLAALLRSPEVVPDDVMKHVHIARLFYRFHVLDDLAVGYGSNYARACLYHNANLEEAMQFLKKVRVWSVNSTAVSLNWKCKNCLFLC